jgi:predicted phage tail protein
MPTLILVRNPFRTSERDVVAVEPCRALAAVLEERYGAGLRIDEFLVSRNGHLLEVAEARELVFGPLDSVALMPRVGKGGKKNVLGIIAAIALITLTMGGGAGAAKGLAGLFGSKGGMLLLGGLLMLIGKPPKPEIPDYSSASSFDVNPEWDTGDPIMVQGRPIPITYGTVRVRAPQVLSQRINSEGKTQTLNLLLSGGEGPVDSVSDFKINDQPASNYYENKETITTTRFSEQVPFITGTTTTRAASGPADRISLKIEFPSGLYLKSGAGSPIEKTWIKLAIEYRDAAVGGAYTLYDTITIEDAFLGRFEAYQQFTPPDTSKTYEFRLSIPEVNVNFTKNDAFWTGILATTNDGDVSFDTRLGTNDQTVMANFRDTYAEEPVGLELDSDWTEFQMAGNASEGIEWTFEFPQGLAYFDDQGNATSGWVLVDIDYREVGAGSWTTHKAAWEVRAAETRNFKVSTRVDGLSAGQYESRVRLDSIQGVGSRFVNMCRWSIVAGIIYDDFERPGRVLVGMTALATDKLQGGVPRVSWTQVRSTVLVWDPTAGGGAGAYVTKAATNPAWICYDLIHRCRILKNIQTGSNEYQVRGDAAAKIDFQAFSDWADFCDELVDGAKRCLANVLVDSAGALWEIVNRIAVTGRGGIVLRGQTWSAVWDEATSPVQLFTAGNVVVDSLSGEFLGGNDRANAIEVSFVNKDRNYERDSVTVFGDDWDASDTTQQPVQVVATGIDDYRRAYREAAYRLRLNKYLRRQISFRADVDAVACQVGDVINFSHDLPRWGESGRLVACDPTGVTLTLDRQVTLDPAKTYEVMVRLADDTIVTKTIVTPVTATTTDQVAVAVAFSPVPAQYDLYAFGETDVSAKPFRVTRISRTDDLHVEITAVEYYPEIYTESMTVPTIAYSTALPTVAGVYANVDFDAGGRAFLVISWTPPRDSYGGATVTVNGALVGRVGATETSLRHEIYEDGAYRVNVIGLSASGAQLAGVQTTIDVTALSIPVPQDVELTEDTYILRDGTVVTDFDVTYTIDDTSFTTSGGARRYPVQRFACAHVEYDPDESGTWIDAGTVTSKTGFRLKNVKADAKIQVRLSVIDKFDAEGAAGLSDVTDITGKSALPDDVAGFDGAQDQYGIALAWTANDDPDIDIYEIRVGASWALGTVVFSGYTERARLNFTNSGTFTYWIKAKDTSGNYSANAATKAVVVSAPATPVATPTAINGGIKIDIVHAPNVDFDHYVVERKPTGGAFTTINSNLRSTTWMDTDIATLGYTTTYEYRVTAVDRNGASGSASTATTATAAKKIETLDITTDQIVAKDFRSATNAGNGAVSGYRIHSGGIEGWNGATKNFCLDGATGTLYAVNACITGTVCATTGVIGGWCVVAGCLYNGNAALCSAGVLKLGAANSAVILSSADATYRIWTGCDTAANAPFRVTSAGALTATNATVCGAITATSGTFTGTLCSCAGNIGGWTLGNGCLTGGAAGLYSAGYMLLGTSNDVVRLDACDATHRLAIGNATMASAPFRVTKAGALTATSATVCGAITATSGAIGGWTVATGCLCGGAAALYSVGCMVLGTTNDVAVISACDATYRLWVGNAVPASAPFFITKAGALTATSATICGAVTATSGAIGGWGIAAGVICSAGGCTILCCTGLMSGGGFASGSAGWRITSDGAAEFNTITARGAFRASVFQYQEVAAVGGQLLVANAGIVRTAVTTPVAVASCFTLDVADPEVGHAAQFAVNDILRVQTWNGTALVAAWGTVTAVSDQTTFYRYTVQLKSGTSQAIPARAAVVSYGTAAAGGGLLAVGQGTCSPYLDAFTTGATPWTATTVQTRIGNLSGIAGATGYGLYTNNGNIYGGVVRSVTFDATSGSCFGLAAGVLQLGGTGGGISKCGMVWDGTNLCIYGYATITAGNIGGFTISKVNCNITAGNMGISACCGVGVISFWAGCATPSLAPFRVYYDGSICASSISGANVTGGNIVSTVWCVQSAEIYGTTCVDGPLVCACTRVQSPIICGSSCVASPTICGTTGVVAGFTVCSPCMVASCCVTGPFVCFNQAHALGFCTTDAHIRFGTGEFQGYSATSTHFTNNIYYSGGWKYRAAGVGVAMVMGGTFSFATVASGAAPNCAATPATQFQICVGCTVNCGIELVCTCVASPAVCGTTSVTTPTMTASTCICGTGQMTVWKNLATTGCVAIICNTNATCTGVALYVSNSQAFGCSAVFTGGNFCVNLANTLNCFVVSCLATGTGTAAQVCTGGRFVCASSARHTKCCIAPWCLPCDFLDRFEPSRYLYCSGINGGAPFLVGAIADDVASFAPEFVRFDNGRPATIAYDSLSVAALSGIKIERDERRREDAALWSCICALELALAKAR